MAMSTVEKLNPTRAKLTITVNSDELAPQFATAYRNIAKQVSIPGFRKGNVPSRIIDQRVGRAVVLEQAVNDSLDGFYRQAVAEHSLKALGQPQADVVVWPKENDFSGELVFEIEVDVRPEVTIPNFRELKVTVPVVEVSEADIDAELTKLMSRFGTLVPVERAAQSGDFAHINLDAVIDGKTVDSAEGVSYEIGSNQLLEGLDDALETLTAGESTTFSSVLVGGDHEGQKAEISVTVTAVKERELPELNDDFAQTASEFDTVAELKDSLRENVSKNKVFEQGAAARDALMNQILENADIPLPQSLIDSEVHSHLEGENRLDDHDHRAEVVAESEKALKSQILLDAIVEAENVQVDQEEFSQYILQGASRYNMDPNEFIKLLTQNGQIGAMVAELARSKALSKVLSRVTVTDTAGALVDLSAFTVGSDDSAPSDDTVPSTETDHNERDEASSGDAGEKSETVIDEVPVKKKRLSKKKSD